MKRTVTSCELSASFRPSCSHKAGRLPWDPRPALLDLAHANPDHDRRCRDRGYEPDADRSLCRVDLDLGRRDTVRHVGPPAVGAE